MDSEKTDWSSTHTRVRIELFVISLVIFCVHFLGLRLGTNAPFYFEFTNRPTQVWSNIFLYSMFGYLLIAFLLRTYNEAATSEGSAKNLRAYSEALQNRVNEMKQASAQITTAAMIDTVNRFENSAANVIRQADVSISSIQAHIQNKAYGAQPMPMPSAPGHTEEWSLLAKRIVDEVNDSLAKRTEDVKAAVAEGVAAVREELQNTETQQRKQHQVVIGSLANVESTTTRLILRMDAWRTLLNTERMWLNVFLPVAISCGLAAAPVLKWWLPDLSISGP